MPLTREQQSVLFCGIMTTLGDKIRIYREAAGLTQGRLGEKLGRVQSEIYRWEKGMVRVPAEELPRLAEVLGVPVAAFFDEKASEGREVDWELQAALGHLSPETRQQLVRLIQMLAHEQRDTQGEKSSA